METTFLNYKISNKYLNNKNWTFGGNTNNYNNHIITVKNIKTSKSINFEYWQSIMQPDFKTEKDLLFAFESFLQGANYGNLSFMDFCNEFGYDNQSGKKVYKACQALSKKADKLMNESDITEVLDYISNN